MKILQYSSVFSILMQKILRYWKTCIEFYYFRKCRCLQKRKVSIFMFFHPCNYGKTMHLMFAEFFKIYKQNYHDCELYI